MVEPRSTFDGDTIDSVEPGSNFDGDVINLVEPVSDFDGDDWVDMLFIVAW